jgi:plastocyanin
MSSRKRAAAALVGLCLIVAVIGRTQNPPAPATDNVGFMPNYAQALKVLYVFDRADNKQVRTIYASDNVFSVNATNQNGYPYGSYIVMETWASLRDAQGNPILDNNGRFQKDPTATPTIFVMRKEKGLGAAYGPNRNGEWEYVAYHTDGTFQTTPQNSFSCAVCHLQAGTAKDYVFRAALHFRGGNGGVPSGVIKDYTYVPGTLHVKAGSAITIYNDDVIAHTIVDDAAGGFASDPLPPGASITLSFPKVPFQWDYHCSIHPSMVHGRVIVDP